MLTTIIVLVCPSIDLFFRVEMSVCVLIGKRVDTFRHTITHLMETFDDYYRADRLAIGARGLKCTKGAVIYIYKCIYFIFNPQRRRSTAAVRICETRRGLLHRRSGRAEMQKRHVFHNNNVCGGIRTVCAYSVSTAATALDDKLNLSSVTHGRRFA